MSTWSDVERQQREELRARWEPSACEALTVASDLLARRIAAVDDAAPTANEELARLYEAKDSVELAELAIEHARDLALRALVQEWPAAGAEPVR